MNEIPKVIASNEKILWDGKPKYSAYMLSALIGVIILFTIVIIFSRELLILGLTAFFGLFFIIWSHLSWNVTHYALTNKRAIIQHGVIGRDFKSIDYDRIQNASVKVGLLGLIFKVGHIMIFTGEMIATGGRQGTSMQPYHDIFKYVSDPYEVLKSLQSNLSRRKEVLYAGKAA